MSAKIGKIIIWLLMISALGYYVYDILVCGAHFMDNLLKLISVVCVCVAALLRSRGRRRSLKFYETAYASQIGAAFRENTSLRKKLVNGYRLFDEGKLSKAETTAEKLKQKCLSNHDRAAVYLLSALVHTDMGLGTKAIAEYEELIARGHISATVYNNLAQLYGKAGQRDMALSNYESALTVDPGHAPSYSNIAVLYFNEGDFGKAIAYAEKALSADARFYQASTLLAIVYYITGRQEESRRYSHMSISSGQNPDDLKRAMDYYKAIYPEENE